MKKGFTLVELLAVIIILGIIALVSVPVALNTIKQGKYDLFDEQIELMKSGAISFVADQIESKGANSTSDTNIYKIFKGEDTTNYKEIQLSYLQGKGYINYNISNPLCNGKDKYFDPEKTIIRITYNGKEFQYDVYYKEMYNEGTSSLEDICTEMKHTGNIGD